MKVLYGHDAFVAQWVVDRIPHAEHFGPASALGVIDKDGKAVAGVVYHDFIPAYGTLQLSMVAETPRWATRSILKELLTYPFEQLGVRKVWTATPLKNQRALRFNKGIGFKQEAVLANHYGDDHAVICRMFKKQFEQLFKGVK
jgi:RimJ/RimL family protein N-acetyltransferase